MNVALIGHFFLWCSSLFLTMQVCFGLMPSRQFELFSSFSLKMRQICVVECARFQFFTILGAFIALCTGFICHNAHLMVVIFGSHETLPYFYRLSALWSNHEGSLLLWVTLLSWHNLRMALRHATHSYVHRFLGVYGMCIAFFMLVLLQIANPFDTLPSPAVNSFGLNPLLQDVAVFIHPPLLYMGLTLLSRPFVMCLCHGFWKIPLPQQFAYDVSWAWCMLTGGILFGSWWASYEWGWGGWWFWDPIENIAFIPWLLCIILLHHARTQRCHLCLMLSGLLSFTYIIWGMYASRSGLLISPHAFGVSPHERMMFMYGAILFSLLASVSGMIYFFRRNSNVQYWRDDCAWRKKSLMWQIFSIIVALLILSSSIFLPLITQQSGLSLSPSFHNIVLLPVVLPPLCLMIYGASPLSVHGILSCIVTLCLTFMVGCLYVLSSKPSHVPLTHLIIMGVSLWIAIGTVLAACVMRKFNAMIVGHFGLAMMLFGISYAGAFRIEQSIKLQHIGQNITFGHLQCKYMRLRTVQQSNYSAKQAIFQITLPNACVYNMHPEYRLYVPGNVPHIETHSFRQGFSRLTLSIDDARNSSSTMMLHMCWTPYIELIWWGGFLMMLAGPLHIWQRKRQMKCNWM